MTVVDADGDGIIDEAHIKRHTSTGKWENISFQREIKMMTDGLQVREGDIFLIERGDGHG